MATQSREYTILLSHLHDPASKLPLETIQSALAHHLASLSPLPTPLAASSITSPFYLSQPFTYQKLQSLSTAFRHGTHLKYRLLVKSAETRTKIQTLLGRSMQSVISQWLVDILKGIQGGHPVLRLASFNGLLLGVEDLRIGQRSENKEGIDVGSARSLIEDETVIALAEAMDTYSHSLNSGASLSSVEEWEREFEPAGQDILSLVLILASQSLPLVAQYRVKILPLPILARVLTSTIASTFKYGTFLSSISASITLSSEHQVHISSTSPLAQTLSSMSSSPLMVSIASLSRLTANILSISIDEPTSSRTAEGLYTIATTFDTLREMARNIERDWIACSLASSTQSDIASSSKGLTTSIWTVLKTFLFSTIMLSEAVLSTAVYLPPQDGRLFTPTTMALQVLNTLSHLSFVISEFGGVTTTTQGFEHLKKTFYLALDILAQGGNESAGGEVQAEAWVQQAIFSLNSQRAETAAAAPRQAKQAFVLASIEQLVPVLSDKCIRNWVWGVCYPHLFDSSHRETYESAHSVILSVFAAHAQNQQQQRQHPGIDAYHAYHGASKPADVSSQQRARNSLKDRSCANIVLSGVLKTESGKVNTGPEEDVSFLKRTNSEDSSISATFVQRMVPFYAKCLIDNSVDGKLNTPQLRLAFSALVRSASASATSTTGTTDATYSLAWYCIQAVLDTVRALSPPAAESSRKGKAKAIVVDEKTTDRVHRLHLMLISSVSSLPLPLMLKALDEIRLLILAQPQQSDGSGVMADASGETQQGKREELLDALFTELLEKTGDREKEAGIQWWYRHRPSLVLTESGKAQKEETHPDVLNEDGSHRVGAGEDHQSNPILSRL